MSNSLDPDQDRDSVDPDLSKLFAKAISRYKKLTLGTMRKIFFYGVREITKPSGFTKSTTVTLPGILKYLDKICHMTQT